MNADIISYIAEFLPWKCASKLREVSRDFNASVVYEMQMQKFLQRYLRRYLIPERAINMLLQSNGLIMGNELSSFLRSEATLDEYEPSISITDLESSRIINNIIHDEVEDPTMRVGIGYDADYSSADLQDVVYETAEWKRKGSYMFACGVDLKTLKISIEECIHKSICR